MAKLKTISPGVMLTVGIALMASFLSRLPVLSVMGLMIIAIAIGIIFKNTIPLPTLLQPGITVSSKYLLRGGIVLMGVRLNINDIFHAGLPVAIIDLLVVVFTLLIMMGLGKLLKVDSSLAILIAGGTAICGAAAIVALSSIIKPKQEYTAIAVSCIAVLGTIGAFAYIILFPQLPLTNTEYGTLVGATLHELAHVVAAGVVGGNDASEMALLVKLGRVLLLIPVAIVVRYLWTKGNKPSEKETIPFPWFIIGFLLVSILQTARLIPTTLVPFLTQVSIFLLASGMAGLGLNIKLKDFISVGVRPILLSVVGFLALLLLTPIILWIL